MQKTWFVTGASRGFGAEIAKAAVRSEDRVVATARKPAALLDRLGPDGGQLISVELDVTDAAQVLWEGLVGANSKDGPGEKDHQPKLMRYSAPFKD
jgi:NAD(P)-dependent dehydrogenase (short-subunit alcohol dehydrogenase family)